MFTDPKHIQPCFIGHLGHLNHFFDSLLRRYNMPIFVGDSLAQRLDAEFKVCHFFNLSLQYTE